MFFYFGLFTNFYIEVPASLSVETFRPLFSLLGCRQSYSFQIKLDQWLVLLTLPAVGVKIGTVSKDAAPRFLKSL
jgi:hypothetical protein